MKKPLTFAISLALSAFSAATLAQSQATHSGGDSKPDHMVSPMVPLTYVGSNARVGVSVNDDGDFSGEGLGILRYTGTSAVLAEGWLGQGGAGGLQLGYNWLWGAKDAQAAIDNPNSLFVAKIFAALDRNAERDRKATIGFGAEKNDLFFTGYLSKGLTDERFVSTRSTIANDVISGTQSGRPFTQSRAVTTIFDSFEQAYDRAIGARIGKYFDSNLFRVRGGLDYANGDFSSHQLTASVGVDKYIEGTGHSFSLDLSHLSKNGDFVADDNDTRAALTYRYSFGESYRPAAWEHAMANPQPENPPTKAAPEVERVAVQNKADLDSDSFFDFDKSGLRDETRTELDRLVGIIKASKLASPITITGHTCSIGTEKYNVGLSNRRANAVAEYFKAAGIETQLVVEGKGELDPTFPNDTRENRKKNRRVDVSFITIEEKMEERSVPASDGGVTYSKQVVTVPPGWIERALRNPGEHRRDVDTYTFTTTRQETALGPVVFTNRAPVAVNDTASVRRNAGATLIPVLANDSDPDADTLTVTSLTTPANGSVTNSGNGVLYTPRTGFVGTDTFSYTVSDGKGGTATATVTVTVSDQAPTAVDDAATVARGATVSVSPLVNDTDPEGSALRVTGIDQPANGTAVLEGNVVRYTAPLNFVGTVSIPYRIADEAGNPANARIVITVGNLAPVANADISTSTAGRPITIDVLANDTDPENDALTLDSVATPANGTAVIQGNRVLYTPRGGFSGTDTFTYVIRDAFGARATGTVRVTVTANAAPTANPETVGILKGQGVDINVLANDIDPEGDTLAVTAVSTATQGTVSINSNGTVRYQHRPGTLGTDTFNYTIIDSVGNTAVGTVTIIINRIIVP
jgi:outer membrane protein OmpA-like peptidoglycan-associated protein